MRARVRLAVTVMGAALGSGAIDVLRLRDPDWTTVEVAVLLGLGALTMLPLLVPVALAPVERRVGLLAAVVCFVQAAVVWRYDVAADLGAPSLFGPILLGAVALGALGWFVRVHALWAAAVVAVLLGVASYPRLQPRPTGTGPDVVLVTWSGASSEVGPVLEEVSRRGTRFASKQGSVDVALTGMLAADGTDLPTVLRNHGYVAGAFVGEPGLAWDVDHFDVWDADPSPVRGLSHLAMVRFTGTPDSRPGHLVNSRARRFLRRRGGPRLAWVHYGDAVSPREPPRGFTDSQRWVDHLVGELIVALPRPTLLVVLGLGEDAPLLLVGPGVPEGRVRNCEVDAADVVPTVLELTGHTDDVVRDGVSLRRQFDRCLLGPGRAPR